MDHLDYRVSGEHDGSFELLMNGLPIGGILETAYGPIPHWLIEDELPIFPATREDTQPSTRIVAVCTCGEYGCGHIRCTVRKAADQVTFSAFQCDNRGQPEAHIYHCSRENYDRVVTAIVRAAQQYNEQMP